jgi:hypothetical protein
MLSGEAAISTLPYLLAYTIFLDPGTRWERARALVPYALVFVAYAVVYTALGYGARGGGMYIDPAREPLTFLSAVGERLPVLLLAQLAFPPADIAMVLSDTRIRAFLPVALVAAPALAVLLWLGARKQKTAAFWAAGMLLSLIPVCATVPSDRLLLFPGIGAFGLVALFLAAARAELSKTPFAARGARGKAGWAALALASLFFVVMHAVIAPLLLPARAVIMGAQQPFDRRAFQRDLASRRRNGGPLSHCRQRSRPALRGPRARGQELSWKGNASGGAAARDGERGRRAPPPKGRADARGDGDLGPPARRDKQGLPAPRRCVSCGRRCSGAGHDRGDYVAGRGR